MPPPIYSNNSGRLYFADCLEVLRKIHRENPKGIFDLIYIDPPFNSKRNYNVLFESIDKTDATAQKEAFKDTWSNISYIDTINEIQDLSLDLYEYLKVLDKIRISKSAVSYLTIMAIRLYYIHKVLKETGSFYLHCDPTMSHYLKAMCDLIFGYGNFRNEIVWCYKEREISKKQYNKKHDVILFFTKSNEYLFNWQEITESYSQGTLKKFNYKDDSGRYFQVRGKKGKFTGKQGLNIELETTHPGYVYRDYLDKSPGVPPRDWFFIPVLNRVAKERLGYPTQKPEALMERIIKASSNKGDLVGDFFCGCGTTVAVAQKLNRRWIACDMSAIAVKITAKRITNLI